MATDLNTRIAVLSLALFFALAWLPLGQQEFFVDHWMKVGAFLAPIIVFLAFKLRERPGTPILTDVTVVASLFAAAYMVHQIEEHWIDLLGREYPLYDVLNTLIANALGPDRYGAMTRSAIMYVNTGLVWTIAFSAILLSPRYVFPSVAMAGLMLVNAVAHLGQAAVAGEYNSGLATGLALFLPLSLSFYVVMHRTGAASPGMIAAGLGWGILSHVLLFGGLIAANVYGVIPVGVYYVALIIWAVVPAFIFQLRVH